MAPHVQEASVGSVGTARGARRRPRGRRGGRDRRERRTPASADTRLTDARREPDRRSCLGLEVSCSSSPERRTMCSYVSAWGQLSASFSISAVSLWQSRRSLGESDVRNGPMSSGTCESQGLPTCSVACGVAERRHSPVGQRARAISRRSRGGPRLTRTGEVAWRVGVPPADFAAEEVDERLEPFKAAQLRSRRGELRSYERFAVEALHRIACCAHRRSTAAPAAPAPEVADEVGRRWDAASWIPAVESYPRGRSLEGCDGPNRRPIGLTQR